jgi:hypothetical protein
MALSFEPTPLSAWIEADRLDRALRVLSDPRLAVRAVGSDDARTRRVLADRFAVDAFDDLRRLAVATDGVLWIDRSAPLGEPEREMLGGEDIAIVAGAGIVVAALAIIPLVGFALVLLAAWLGIRSRRDDQTKYGGLRVLR